MSGRKGLLGRRDVALLAGLFGTGCSALPSGAAAQPQRPTPQNQPARRGPAPRVILMPPPMPCADGPGDICALLLEGSGAPAGTVAVFGQAFRRGDLPRGAQLSARLAAGGQAVPVQLDVSRRHPDGSARFGLVSIAAPELPQGQRAGIVLARRDEAPGPPLDIALLQGRSAVVEIRNDGATPWRIDLTAALRALPPGERWQSGPLALQGRVEARVPMGAVTSLRLVCDVALRADRSLWVDMWLRNDIAMQPGGGEVRYAVRLLIDGQPAIDETLERHWHYGAWGRLVGGRVGSAAHNPPRHIPDPVYLAATAAIMPYDLTVGVDRVILERLLQEMERPSWNVPFAARGMRTSMGAPGARPDLGVTTNYQAAWLITGDAGAAAVSIGQAEAGAGVQWHFWDINGGTGSGGWLDVKRWPRLWSDTRGGAPPRTLVQPVPINTLWERGGTPSHQPSFFFVPYLMTGRRAFLDCLTAQAAWNIVQLWPTVRSPPDATPAQRDIILVHDRQIRSRAWCMRCLDEATWIMADSDPNFAYLNEVNDANWAYLRERIPEWRAVQGQAHGYIRPMFFGHNSNLAPWQQDYFASSAANAARRGQEDARAFVAFMRNFIVGRFLASADGFPRNDAVAYRIAYAPRPAPPLEQPPQQPFMTWAEIGEATRERGDSNGDGWRASEGEYGRLGMLSLALFAHVLGDEQATAAWRDMAASDLSFVRARVFQIMPYQTVSPPGVQRVPENAQRCTATAPARR